MKNLKNRRNLNAEVTMNQILTNSTRLFLEKGYHGTSIDEITKACGLTKGAFYGHFESKEGLLERIVEEFERQFLDGLIQAVGATKGTAIDKFEKMLSYNSSFAYYNRELCVSHTTLSAELLGASHKIEGKIKNTYKRYQTFLAEITGSAIKEGVFKKEIDPTLAALVIMALHDGMLLQWSMNRDSIDGKKYVETFVNIIMNGLLNCQKPQVRRKNS